MFKENGALRTATSKFALKNALAKPRLSHQKADIFIVDASAQLWVTAWPGKGGLVSDLINTFRQFIARQLDLKQDVYIVFDRYHQDSIKGHTRIVRAIGVTRRLNLQLASGDRTAVAEGSSDGHAKRDATYRPNSPKSSRRSHCEQTEAGGHRPQ